MNELRRIYDVKPGRPFYKCLKTLIILGCLPTEKESKTKFLVKILLIQLFLVTTFMMTVVYIFMNIKSHADLPLTNEITVTVISGNAFILTYLFIRNSHKCLQLCSDLVKMVKFGEPVGFKPIIKKIDRFNTAFIILCCLNVSCYAITSLFTIDDCERYNEQHGTNRICKCFMSFWLPVENITLPVTYFIMFAQFFSAIVGNLTTFSVIFWMFTGTRLIVAHIDHLKLALHSIFEESEPNEKGKKLKSWITYHQHILRMTTVLGDACNIILGHYGVTLALCLAVLGNAFLYENSLRMASLCIQITLISFISCHHGQMVIDATLSVNDAVYSSNWYECDVKMMKDILLILMRSQKPVGLGMMPTGSLGYPMFLMILRSTYSFLTVFSRNT